MLTTDTPVIPTLDIGHHRLPCSICDKGKHDTALSVTVESDRVIWCCFRCGSKGAKGRDGIGRATSASRRVERPTSPSDARERALRIWNQCIGLRGTLGESYLRLRCCVIPPADGDLRFHPGLRFEDRALPALVGRVTTVTSNQFVGVHRIWIEPGSPRAISKRRLGGSEEPVCIRLWPDEDVEQGLAIAEGVESALAAASKFTPVWATVDAGQMAKFPILPGLSELAIFADHDPVGIAAAQDLRERYQLAGARARAIYPREPGTDINDVAQLERRA